MHGQQNIYKKNIDRSVKCVILDLPNTFYQTFHNISYFECLRSVKMEAVPVSYTSSHPRKWHSSLSPPKAPNISNYNWDRNVAGITNSTRNRHATPWAAGVWHCNFLLLQTMVVMSRDFEDGVVSALVDRVSFVSNNIPRRFRLASCENTLCHTHTGARRPRSRV